AIEAGVPDIWYQYVGLDGKVIAHHEFGLSAPGAEVMKERGIDAQHVIEAAKSLYNASSGSAASSARSSKRVKSFRKVSLTWPIGPFLCLAIISSALPSSSVR